MRNHERGRQGEALALQYLLRHGHFLVARNYTCRYGEVDTITKKGNFLVFVEVKLRSKITYWPREAVDRNKQRKIIATADYFLKEKHFTDQVDWRIDVVEIVIKNSKPAIEYIENAVTRDGN